jgi:hypothetical protein
MKPTIYIPSALARLLIPRLPSFDCANKPALEWRTGFRPLGCLEPAA